MTTITSHASITINASVASVWNAVTNPETVKKWFFGTTVESDWQKGSPIVFRGEWEGKTYEDKGIIQDIIPGKLLEYTHLSSRTDQADQPENYEVIRFELTENTDGQTVFDIHESNLPSTQARDKSIGIWNTVLNNLKQVVEA